MAGVGPERRRGAAASLLAQSRWAYPVLLVGLGVAYVAWPGRRPVTVAGLGLVTVAAALLGSFGRRPARRGAWLLIAAAVALLAMGDVALVVLEGDGPGPVSYPAAPDVFYLAAYFPLTVGLLWLGRPRLPSRDWAIVLDTAALSVAGSLLVWIFLVRPAIMSAQLSSLGKVVAIASWVGYVAVLAACARVLLAWRTNLALGLLGAGVAAFLVSDFRYGQTLVARRWSTTSLVDLGFLAFMALCGAAALTPSATRVVSAAFARHHLGPGRLTMLAVTLLVGPTALLVEATMGPVSTGVAIAVVCGIVSLLMLIRLALSARAYRRRAAREYALRATSRALVVATTEAEVAASLSEALLAMLPAGVPSSARLADATAHDRLGRVTRVSPATDPVQGELAVRVDVDLRGQAEPPSPSPPSPSPPSPSSPSPTSPSPTSTGPSSVRPPTRLAVFRAPMADLIELAPILESLAEHAGSALARIALVTRVGIEARESYFRTLVLTSSEVTVISRGGRVEYATPPANAMFGVDVVGSVLDDLVDVVNADGSDSLAPMPPTAATASVPGVETVEGEIKRPDGSVVGVVVTRRDLSDDPTVRGVVTTLRDVTAERELSRALAFRASHDALTGLANADAFRQQLRVERQRSAADQFRLGAVLFVDLDDFKTVNDTFGHEIGDGLLTTVARRIRANLRGGDLAARLGGDEFAVLLRDVPDADAARVAAERISSSLAVPAAVAGITVDSQASIGVAMAARPSDYDSLLAQADAALYTAKSAGKGRWREYRAGMANPVRRRADLRAELEAALRDGGLGLVYQPIVDLTTEGVYGFEALVRAWQSTGDGGAAMSPEDLVRVAESNGLIVPVGDWVLRQSMTDLVRLNPPGRAPRYVSVNVSPVQLRQPGFVERFRELLAQTGADPARMVLEITETLLVREDERAWDYLAELSDEGVRVAIDDYGTGYASLSYLRQPIIDIVKIDRSFLLDPGPRGRTLVEAVVSLTSSLGLDQIVEGVEDKATAIYLRGLGCRYGQGFFYAEPMPVESAMGWTRGGDPDGRRRPDGPARIPR